MVSLHPNVQTTLLDTNFPGPPVESSSPSWTTHNTLRQVNRFKSVAKNSCLTPIHTSSLPHSRSLRIPIEIPHRSRSGIRSDIKFIGALVKLGWLDDEAKQKATGAMPTPSFRRQPLVGGKSLYWPHALSHNMEHSLELPCNFSCTWVAANPNRARRRERQTVGLIT